MRYCDDVASVNDEYTYTWRPTGNTCVPPRRMLPMLAIDGNTDDSYSMTADAI